MSKIERAPHTSISTEVLQDGRLSFTALGVYAFIASYSDGVDTAEIIEFSGTKDSPEDIEAALAELAAAGYLK